MKIILILNIKREKEKKNKQQKLAKTFLITSIYIVGNPMTRYECEM